MTEEKETILGYEYSPACYHNGMRVNLLNAKKYVSLAEIQKFYEKGIIQEADIILLEKLFEFRFLTRHTATCLIKEDTTIRHEYKKSSYKMSFNKLVGCGVVHRYQFVYEENDEIRQTPCIYALSRTAYDYIKRLYGKNHFIGNCMVKVYPNSVDVIEMLKFMAFAQFHVAMLQHKEILVRKYINYEIPDWRWNHMARKIPGIYLLHNKGCDLPIELLIFPIRSNTDWKKDLLVDIEAVRSYIKRKNSIIKMPIYVFLCENGSHSVSCAKWIKTQYGEDFPVLFTVDRATNTGNILNSLYQVEFDEQENHRFLFRKIG